VSTGAKAYYDLPGHAPHPLDCVDVLDNFSNLQALLQWNCSPAHFPFTFRFITVPTSRIDIVRAKRFAEPRPRGGLEGLASSAVCGEGIYHLATIVPSDFPITALIYETNILFSSRTFPDQFLPK